MFSQFRVESAIRRTTLVLLLVCLAAAGVLAQNPDVTADFVSDADANATRGHVARD